jgi:hypothetical protein
MSTRNSSCTISGFFFLIRCTRLEGDAVFETPNERHATAVDGSHFLYYETTVTCMDGHTTITIIRARSDSNDVDQPITSVAFLTGTFFINSSTQSAYLDITEIKHICNWPYVDTDPAFFNTSIAASGVVCGLPYELDDGSIVFPVKLSVYILNDIKSFRLMYDHFFPLSLSR